MDAFASGWCQGFVKGYLEEILSDLLEQDGFTIAKETFPSLTERIAEKFLQMKNEERFRIFENHPELINTCIIRETVEAKASQAYEQEQYENAVQRVVSRFFEVAKTKCDRIGNLCIPMLCCGYWREGDPTAIPFDYRVRELFLNDMRQMKEANEDLADEIVRIWGEDTVLRYRKNDSILLFAGKDNWSVYKIVYIDTTVPWRKHIYIDCDESYEYIEQLEVDEYNRVCAHESVNIDFL